MDVVMGPLIRRHGARWEIASRRLCFYLTNHTILNAATHWILPIHRMQTVDRWRESGRTWCRLRRILIWT